MSAAETDKQRLPWNDCGDPKLKFYKSYNPFVPWPRMNMGTLWEVELRKIWSAETHFIYKTCEKELGPPRDNPKCPFKLYRFVLMDIDYLSKVINYLINEHSCIITMTAQQLFDDIQWPRALLEETKQRVRNDPAAIKEVYGRAAITHRRWCQLKNSRVQDKHIHNYVRKHGKNVHHGALSNPQAKTTYVDPKIMASTKFTLVTNDQWQQYDWNPGVRGDLVICPNIIYLEFGLTLGKKSRIVLGDHDMSSPKNCSLKLYDSNDIAVLYTEQEIETIIYENEQAGYDNQVLKLLLEQTQTLTCNKQEFESAKVELSDNKEHEGDTTTFTLIGDKNYGPHFLESVFKSFENNDDISKNLLKVLEHLAYFKVGFEAILPELFRYLVFYKAPGKTLGKDEYVGLTMHVHDNMRSTAKYLNDSKFEDMMAFWISCCWSKDYTANPPVSLKLKHTDVEWNNVPVSIYEVLLWYDKIIAYIDELGSLKNSLNQWWKTWLRRAYLVNVFVQILDYMGAHVQNLINEMPHVK